MIQRVKKFGEQAQTQRQVVRPALTNANLLFSIRKEGCPEKVQESAHRCCLILLCPILRV